MGIGYILGFVSSESYYECYWDQNHYIYIVTRRTGFNKLDQ